MELYSCGKNYQEHGLPAELYHIPS